VNIKDYSEIVTELRHYSVLCRVGQNWLHNFICASCTTSCVSCQIEMAVL